MSDEVQIEEKETFSFSDNHGKKYELPKVLLTDQGEIPLNVLFGHAIAKERKATKDAEARKYESIVNELNTIKGEYESVTGKLTEIETTGLSEKDKKLRELESKLSQYEKKQKDIEEQSRKNFEQFQKERIKSDIYGSFTGVSLQNQEHTERLFRESGKIELVPDNEGNYKTLIKMTLPNSNGEYEEIEGTPRDVFPKWIALEQNSYLLKNNLQAGGGSSKTGNVSNTMTKFKKSEIGNIPEVTKAFNAAIAAGVVPEVVE